MLSGEEMKQKTPLPPAVGPTVSSSSAETARRRPHIARYSQLAGREVDDMQPLSTSASPFPKRSQAEQHLCRGIERRNFGDNTLPKMKNRGAEEDGAVLPSTDALSLQNHFNLPAFTS